MRAPAGGFPISQKGLDMRRPSLLLLILSCITGSLLVVEGSFPLPQSVRIVSGLAIVFFLSGFALVAALSPERQLGPGERVVASVGISLAVTTCCATLLAAASVGLTRDAMYYALGGSTVVLSLVAIIRRLASNDVASRGRGLSGATQS
jgi:uncharacterized membrane protein